MTCSATVCMFFIYIMTKINFYYHATVLAIWFYIAWQFDNSSSWTCPNIAQCTIGIGLRFFILISSISGAVFFSYNSTILQFSHNFSLVVDNSVCLFVCLFCFVLFFFSLCFLVTNQFYNNEYTTYHCRSQNKFASQSLLLTWFDIGNYKKGKNFIY